MSKEQIRELFLNRQWRRYPAIPDRIAKDPSFRRGRFKDHSGITLKLREASDPDLGPAMPLDAAKSGDIVLLRMDEIDKNTVTAIFLLSPSVEDTANPINGEWQRFLEAVGDHFKKQGFTHWKTPYLLPSAGVDAHIDFFKVEGCRTKSSFYLPTSPELELKKVIAAGHDKVFEIKSCFRDDDKSPHHNPEFTMLEWYRSYADKWELLKDIEELVTLVSRALLLDFTPAPIKRRSLSELFQEYVGMELSPRTAKPELSAALTQHKLHQDASDDWDDLFFRLYIDLVEPHLGKEGLEAIYNFPATQGSLARTNAEGWADRFEIYWKGVELANAYQEQNDPFLIEVRVRGEVQKRLKLGRASNGIDEEFLKIMKAGFPPCAGIALGLDRLFMVIKNQTSI